MREYTLNQIKSLKDGPAPIGGKHTHRKEINRKYHALRIQGIGTFCVLAVMSSILPAIAFLPSPRLWQVKAKVGKCRNGVGLSKKSACRT